MQPNSALYQRGEINMFKKLFILQLSLVFLFLTGSCIPESGLAGKPQIRDFSIDNPSGSGCGEDNYLIITTDENDELEIGCVIQCIEDTHQASSEEIDEIKDIFLEDENRDESDTSLIDDIDNSKGLCLDDVVEIIRPSDQVYVKKDFCACINGKPDILNNCEGFCSTNAATVSTLSGNVSLGPDISLNENLGNLYNWCNKELDNGETAPSCTLEVYDGSNTDFLKISIKTNSNSFTANISNLDYDKTYVARIVESGSGSNANSDSFQIRRRKYEDFVPSKGPLKIIPVSQYSCIQKSGSTDSVTGDIYFNEALRFHFYYPSNNKPPPLEPGNDLLKCHDVFAHGNEDNVLFDRLELIPQHFSIWDQADVRFFDISPQDSKPDINTLIQDKLVTEYGITSTINIFNLFNWPNRPNSDSPNVGFFMQPFIDPLTGRGFCPTQEHYNGTSPTFKILKEIVGVDTEGIFIGVREGKSITDASGNKSPAPLDFILIRENLLKKVWFYFENSQHFVPDEITATQKTIHFYWPPDAQNPYIQKSDQEIYTIREPSTIGTSGATSGLQKGLRPPDKRFGCIPALD